MSAFFALVSAALYGVCHLLARTAKPTHSYSFQHEMIFDGDVDTLKKALHNWVTDENRLELHTDQSDTVIIDQRGTWLFFGAYFYFKIHNGDGNLIIAIATEPKLISTGREKALIIDTLCRYLENKAQEVA